MKRLSDIELAERKLVRQRLEGMTVAGLRGLASSRGVDLHGARTKLCVINTLMNNYERWHECS